MKLPLQSIVFVLLCFIVIQKDRGVKTQMLYPLFFFFLCSAFNLARVHHCFPPDNM